jgi:histidyl-tRNA synthetase
MDSTLAYEAWNSSSTLEGTTKPNNMLYDIEQQAKGTRILFGDEPKQRRELLNKMIAIVEAQGFNEIILPSLEMSEIYVDKAGPEILNQMYTLTDKGNRALCLRPEGTATVQLLADKYWKTQKDVKMWYFERCWRYERPQAGRYREFFQFGIEWLNPRDSEAARLELIEMAKEMVSLKTKDFVVNDSAKRGLSYYTDSGFEIAVESLGAQKQVVGGGPYKQGIGFAVGFDRLMLS